MLEFDGACWFQCLPAESVVLKKFPVDSVFQLPAVINTRKGRQALRCASGEKQLWHAEEGSWNKQLAGSLSILSCGFILPQLPLKLKNKYKSMFCWNLRTTKTVTKYTLRNQYIRFSLQKLQPKWTKWSFESLWHLSPFVAPITTQRVWNRLRDFLNSKAEVL